MPESRIIVIGASAGGVNALQQLLAPLPAKLPASIFITTHLSSDGRSYLPDILQRATGLTVVPAQDQQTIAPGHIYVAVPDCHLLVHRGYIRVLRGPRENRHRPAIDPMFRSAARNYGPRVVGIVLTGLRDDGAAGLLAIHRANGTTIVQDPSDAEFGDMPRAAMHYAEPDHVATLAEIPELLVKLVGAEAPATATPVSKDLKYETDIMESNMNSVRDDERPGEPSSYVCPECSGTLYEIKDGDMLRFRCRVGHAYSPESVVEAKSEATEAALWAALRSLEESAHLSRRLADRVSTDLRGRFLEEASSKEQHASLLRDILTHDTTLSPTGTEG